MKNEHITPDRILGFTVIDREKYNAAPIELRQRIADLEYCAFYKAYKHEGYAAKALAKLHEALPKAGMKLETK